jgi:hypothetical protein
MRPRHQKVFAHSMARFIVEHYLPGSTAIEREGDVERTHDARAALSGDGAVLMSSVIVDADEMCMHLFDADAAATVVAAHTRVGLECDRIVEVRMSWFECAAS